MNYKNSQGFTLIEAVIAIFLLAIMSLMAYQALSVVLDMNQRSRSDLADEIRLHRTWQIMTNDLTHLRPRAFSDGLGGKEFALETDRYGALISFSRGNDALLESNPSGVSRVRYVLNDSNQLLRSSQPIFLSPRDYEADEQVLLENILEVKFEQLSKEGFFVPTWPPLNTTQSTLSLPRMMRVTITLADNSSTSRLFPGVENDS